MSNDAYKERYNRDNPNLALIHALKQAGVDIRVWGIEASHEAIRRCGRHLVVTRPKSVEPAPGLKDHGNPMMGGAS